MAIQRINMAVPVGESVDSRTDSVAALTAEVAREGEEFQVLLREFSQLLAERSRWCWTRKGAQRRRDKFDVQTKGLIKRFAHVVADLVDDRHARRRVRVRIYGDLISMLQVLTLENDVRVQGRKSFTGRAWLIVAVVVAGGGLVLASQIGTF